MQRSTRSPIHLALALALAGCDPIILDPIFTTGASVSSDGSGETDATTSTTGTTSTTSTTSTTGEMATTTAVETGGDPSDTGGDPPGENFLLPPGEEPGCDPWAQDCPAGFKCAAEGPPPLEHDSVACTAIVPEPDQAGEPCQVLVQGHLGPDTCDAGLFCWNGTCTELCQGSQNDPVCDPGTQCVVFPLPLCLANCDPLLQDCQANETCVGSVDSGQTFICLPLADPPFEQTFDPCGYPTTCDAGLVCVSPEGAVECDAQDVGCCTPYCQLGAPNNCPGAGQVCLPWHDPGQAPPGLEEVGVCHLPL